MDAAAAVSGSLRVPAGRGRSRPSRRCRVAGWFAFTGAPSMALSSALQILKTWRAAERDDAAALGAPRPGLAGCGPLTDIAELGDAYRPVGSPADLGTWRRIQEQTRSSPPLIAAAIAWDAWLTLLHGLHSRGWCAPPEHRRRDPTQPTSRKPVCPLVPHRLTLI